MLHRDIRFRNRDVYFKNPGVRIGVTKNCLNEYTYWQIYYMGEEKDFKIAKKEVNIIEDIVWDRPKFNNN